MYIVLLYRVYITYTGTKSIGRLRAVAQMAFEKELEKVPKLS